MKQIPLTKGYVAVVDDADFQQVSQRKWTAGDVNRNGQFIYAYRSEKRTIDGKKVQRRVYLHREIAGAHQGQVVDHINHDTLDNRRCNLRVVSAGQNLANNRQTVGSTGFRGVSRKGPFHYVARAGRGSLVVSYASAVAAARGYDALAHAKWGDCARLNFPELRPGGQEHAAR